MTTPQPTATNPQAQQVLDFWFHPNHQPFWFAKDDAFDAQIHSQFLEIWQSARQGECHHWREDMAGRLAEILVLDQFSRNLCRNQAVAFAQDGMALVLAQEAIRLPDYQTLPSLWQKFVIMPFMHSESPKIHEQAVALFLELGDESTLDFEYRHKAIIDKFGRYPHRNAILGRTSTADEQIFLGQEGSSF